MRKKVALAGFGVEGLSAYQYFKRQGVDITIFDDKAQPNASVPEGAPFIHGANWSEQLIDFDIVVRSPALHPQKIKTNGVITSVTKEFFRHCPAQIIGVTGSKGKGTVSSLIYNMLQNAGINTHLAGNIGVPALDILPEVRPDDVVVLELSSFQLWDLKQSPHIAVVLMMEPDHLDVHSDMQEYMQAKANIANWQATEDITIYLPSNEQTKKVALVGEGKKIPYTQEPGAHIAGGRFVMQHQAICRVDELGLSGKHNAENACAAITAAWQCTQDTKAIAKALREFKGLPHRLQFVREVGGVQYFDDSIATTPTSAIAAIQAFEQSKIVILGGSDKGADFTGLAKEVASNDVRAVLLVGEMRHMLHSSLEAAGYKGEILEFDQQRTMQQIVEAAAKRAQPGSVVLLSPACASYDMFKGYKDRGEQFIAAVLNLS